jgi:hypothetical protein
MGSEMKWTFGPWKLVEDGDEAYVCGAGADDRIVCDFNAPYYGETGPDATATANANLVVSAPDLYAALEGFLAVFWPTAEEGHTGFVDRLGMQFYEETRIWPPFKSAPMETAREPTEEDSRAWRAWLEAKRDQAAAAGAAMVSPSPRPAENEGNEAKENA